MKTDIIICKSCGTEYKGSFCNNCGQKNITERNTLKHFINIAFNCFDLNRGVIFTAISLFKNPGKVINDYISGKTKPYYNPLSYLFIIASIYALLMIWLNVFDSGFGDMKDILGHDEQQAKLQSVLNSYIKKYMSFISILILPFYSLISMWVLKRHKLNYAEHLIINSYFIAQYLLTITILILVLFLIPSVIKYVMLIGSVVYISYYSYSFKSVFKISIIRSLLASLATFIGGMVIFYVFIIIVTIIVLFIMSMVGIDVKNLIQQ